MSLNNLPDMLFCVATSDSDIILYEALTNVSAFSKEEMIASGEKQAKSAINPEQPANLFRL
eukprot:scaffold331106_cov39-Prasinocladus_malaysianus.AAC.1